MLKIEFSTSNADFEGDAPATIASILRNLATRMAANHTGEAFSGPVRDGNGNCIGSWSYEPDEGGEADE